MKFKINLYLSVAAALYLTIQGSLKQGYIACMGLTQVTQCSILQAAIQIFVFTIIVFIALTLIFGGIKILFKKRKSKPKKINPIKEKVKIKETTKVETIKEKPEEIIKI